MSFYLLVSLVFVLFTTTSAIRSHPLSDGFIAHINSKQSLWTAGRNFPRGTPLIYFKRLMGTLRDNTKYYLPVKRFIGRKKLPIHFDARQKWPNCLTLNEIRDQGSCGSCWAVSAVSTMTDRVCIESNGSSHFYFSEDDVLACCNNCGVGCDGGLLSRAWTYTQTEGTVSGGSYDSRQGCKPYEIAPCNHEFGRQRAQCGFVQTPECKPICQSSYLKKYSEDKRKIKGAYELQSTRAMKRDIYRHGPITTTFGVYEDFINYKSGVYRYVAGKYVGDHSVRLLGWGEENGVKYWLAANSWNTDWGDKGFFKILRGKNHCGIEDSAVAGHVVP